MVRYLSAIGMEGWTEQRNCKKKKKKKKKPHFRGFGIIIGYQGRNKTVNMTGTKNEAVQMPSKNCLT